MTDRPVGAFTPRVIVIDIVYFVDAAHFVWAPFPGYVWCLMRLFVRSATGRKRYSVLGALDAVTHQIVRVCDESYTVAGREPIDGTNKRK
jgi:hypothetical protein